MTGGALRLESGRRFLFEGDAVAVVGFDGRTVTLRWDRDRRVQSLAVSVVAAHARELPVASGRDGQPQQLAQACASASERAEAITLAGHIREVLTGFKSGDPAQPLPGEPLVHYSRQEPLKARYARKAAELGVTTRTVERWITAFRADGIDGLVDARGVRGLSSTVDPRWEAAVEAVVADSVSASTPSTSALIRRARERLERDFGPGVVPAPSKATAYRRVKSLTRGTNAVSGSAKGRRSIADRPATPYGRLVATRPGEYVVLDTQDLDVFAMEEVTGRWVGRS